MTAAEKSKYEEIQIRSGWRSASVITNCEDNDPKNLRSVEGQCLFSEINVFTSKSKHVNVRPMCLKYHEEAMQNGWKHSKS
jgi:hypothetical protein